jgi:hypothetical protein
VDEKQLLEKLVGLQEEHNALFKKHLFRLRFSLLGLLVLMTLTCLLCGFSAYGIRQILYPPTPMPPALGNNFTPMQPPLFPQPTNQTVGDLFGEPTTPSRPVEDPFAE